MKRRMFYVIIVLGFLILLLRGNIGENQSMLFCGRCNNMISQDTHYTVTESIHKIKQIGGREIYMRSSALCKWCYRKLSFVQQQCFKKSR